MGKIILITIDDKKIDISSVKEYFIITYKLPYCNIIGIPIDITITSIEFEYHYYKLFLDNESCKNIHLIDTYFNSKIKNYNKIIKYNSINKPYIKFKHNTIVATILNTIKNNTLTINIIKLKKHSFYNSPILYLL
tara:strand:- start:86 stop:490 length:405 start_codon:yes stop_codon:yes gene_type:complete